MTNRYKTRVGSYEIGDKIGAGNAVVTGFGKSWTENLDCDLAAAWSLPPEQVGDPITVCYAYCTED